VVAAIAGVPTVPRAVTSTSRCWHTRPGSPEQCRGARRLRAHSLRV